MAGEVAGSVMILKIEITASPGTFATLTGQTSLNIPGDAVMADTTNKDGVFEQGKAVLSNGNIDFEYNVDPTDQAHIDLNEKWEARATVEVEVIREDGTGLYKGEYAVAKLGRVAGVTDIVRNAGQLVPAEDPVLT